jgi:hypothetical protein
VAHSTPTINTSTCIIHHGATSVVLPANQSSYFQENMPIIPAIQGSNLGFIFFDISAGFI